MRSADFPSQQPYVASLWRLSAALNSSLDLPRVLATAQQLIVEYTGAERGLILLVDESGDLGGSEPGNRDGRTVLERALAGEVVQSLEPLDEGEAEPGAPVRGVRCVLCVPLPLPISIRGANGGPGTREAGGGREADGDPAPPAGDPAIGIAEGRIHSHARAETTPPIPRRVIGVMYLESRARFDPWHQELVAAFANHAAVAIENARLYNRLQEDFEERIRLQRRLLEEEQRRSMLEEVSRAKSDILSHVSHELRNPLAVIRGYAEELIHRGESRFDAAWRRTVYEEIAAAADRLRALILQNLDTARLEAGRPLGLRREPVEIEAILRDLARFAPYYPYCTDRHRVAVEVPEPLPEVSADEDKLFQVLQNLVSNAIKYSPGGGLVTLAARAQGEALLVRVTDEGEGVPPEERERLFTSYGTVDEAGRPRLGGTGLGLYLSRHLVELHGGRLWVEWSEVGKGSCFAFTLPLTA